MGPLVFRAFTSELREKLATSAAKSLAVIERRIAQGARVAPSLLAEARQAAAAGMATTPRATRRLALDAADAARTQESARGLARWVGPTAATDVAATRPRVERALAIERANPAAVRTGQQLSPAYEGYMTDIQRAYSPAHKAQVMPAQRAPLHVARVAENTPEYSWASEAAQSGPATVIERPRRQPADLGTAHTTLAAAPTGAQLAQSPAATPISGIRPAADGTNPGIAARRARRFAPIGAAV